jgi:hypothetical protein
MNVWKGILAASFFLVASASAAGDYSMKICKLQTSDNGQAYLSPCGEWTTKHNCPSTGPWITWDTSTDSGKLMYSTALTAFVANKTITFRTDGRCNAYDVTSMIRINED